MDQTYECTKCGVISVNKNHLCQPQPTSQAAYCGTNPDRDICDSMHAAVSYECSVCGRAAEDKELLCHPRKTQ